VLGAVDADALSEAAGVGVTDAVSDDEFFEITAIARIKIPTTTAMIIPLDEPVSLLLLVCFDEYEEPDEAFGVVEIVETDERDEPLTGTAGIE
jgi:hypothetical protein